MGVIKIPAEEILDDYATNNTESMIVGTDRQEVLDRIQTAFAREFERYGNQRNPKSCTRILKLSKHGQGLESILKVIRIRKIIKALLSYVIIF